MTPESNAESTADPSPMLVYDGFCGFCSHSVQFLLRHERRHDLSFVTRNSELGKELRRIHGLESVESMLWIEGGQALADLVRARQQYERIRKRGRERIGHAG
jgi:predicted DCC family thiol-disulfide oxidoreductase YuxK